MTELLSTRLRALRGDAGVALVTAIAVVGLVSILCVTLVTVSIAEARGSGRERQRAAAVAFAEGQVDTTLAEIQSSAPNTLPCAATGTSPVPGPDGIGSDTVVTYYDATGIEVACDPVTGPVAEVASALVSTTATSNALAGAAPARRTMETLINLSPTVELDGLDNAIFGNSGVRLSNNGEVFGQDGVPNADVYTNGNFTCNNNQLYQGSVYAQGAITLASTCTIDVDAWAGTGFTADNTGVTVKGDVKVGNGNAVFNAKGATVSGTVSTSGSIQGNQWRGVNCPGKCTEGSSPGMPPAQDFPEIPFNDAVRAEYVAAGFTNVVEINTGCNPTGDSNKPGKWLLDNAASLPGPTMLVTACGIKLQKNSGVLALNNNLVIFATGGFDISNSLTIRSTTSDERNLYFIHPYNAVSVHPCTSDGIKLENRVTLESTVNLLLYSPCNIRKANNADHFGQIYAGGNAVIDNRLTMYYEPLPVWGITNMQTILTGYELDIVYKRENVG